MEISAVIEREDKPKSFVSRFMHQLHVNRLFFFCVVIPTLLAIFYFGFFASDIYISESRFVIRGPQRQAATALGTLLQGGFSRSQDDTFSVQEFILSRDALKKMDEKLAITKMFSRHHVDRISRFPQLDGDDSFEALYRYYQRRVSININSGSSISTLRVNAFSADDAYRINALLLEMGESFINQLNERGRQDMIRFAAAEVDAAEKKVKEAAAALSEYRNDKALFDPDRQSTLQLQQISKMQDELIANKMQLAQIRLLAPDNPQIYSLQKRIETLQTTMDTEMAKIAGGDSSLTNKAAEYERLILARGFADKQLGVALSSLEQAHNDAQRKQLYLERIAQPNKPDVAVEPRRLRGIFVTFVVSLVVWGILVILFAGIREHRD